MKKLWEDVTVEKSKITLVALVMVGQSEIQKRLKLKSDTESDASSLTHRQFRLAKHFGNFALEIYMPSFLASNDNIYKKLGLANPCDVIFTCFKGPTGDQLHPDFVIIRDHETKSFVLIIRGTFDLKDVLIDLDSEDSPFLDGYAHAGILTGAQEILKMAEPILSEEMKKKPNFKLVISGHSLGAGTAELITMMILSNKEEYSDLLQNGVKCYALAPPPVYRSEQKIPDEIVNSIEIYINNYDCIPSLSFATVKKLLSAMSQIDKLQLSTIGDGLLLAGSIFGDMDGLIGAIESSEQMDFSFLHHPGTIFHLEYRDKKYYHIQRRPSEIFSRSLIVRLGMVLDHIHDSYKSAFSSVDQLSLHCSSSFKKSLRKSWFRFTRASLALRRDKEDGKNKTDQNETNEI
jgi:hypothetical protein